MERKNGGKKDKIMETIMEKIEIMWNMVKMQESNLNSEKQECQRAVPVDLRATIMRIDLKLNCA